MRNPLDLNNFPDDFTTKHTLDDHDSSSSSAASGISEKRKIGGKDKNGKVYECRFCSLKFSKSQALGGHMNRHRQERENEALNNARQLVFSNDSILPPLRHQLGSQPVVHGGFHHHQAFYNMSPPPSPQPPQHIYTSLPPSRLNNHHPNYFVGHLCYGNPPIPFSFQPLDSSTLNYTCIGSGTLGGQSFTLAQGNHQDGF